MIHNIFVRTNRWKIVVLSIVFVCVTFLGSSCKKFVEIPPAPNLIVKSQVFADSGDATAAVLGLYVSMMNNSALFTSMNGSITLYTGLASDELYSTRGVAEENSIYANSILPTNFTISGLWSGPYSIIFKANSCIEGISSSSGLSTSSKNQLLGEAKFIRAFLYFNLVNLYGPAPIITSSDYNTNAILARSSVDSVYSLITNDLLDAQNLLLPAYPSAGRVRPNSFAATALLARVYLYRRQWANAEALASQIISNTPLYALMPLNSVFLSTIVTPSNKEAIFQIIPVQAGFETAEGTNFIPTSSSVKPKYVVDSFLIKAFEPNDQRKVIGNWLKSNTISGVTYYYPNKYKLGKDNNTTPAEDYMILRLGEQYLIRAEARAQLSNISGAQSDLNAIRSRAGLSATTANTQIDLLNAIFHERQVELFCEWGHRWYDLKRTGNIDTIMSGICSIKGGIWNANWGLFPIYANELLSNPFLTQNSGY